MCISFIFHSSLSVKGFLRFLRFSWEYETRYLTTGLLKSPDGPVASPRLAGLRRPPPAYQTASPWVARWEMACDLSVLTQKTQGKTQCFFWDQGLQQLLALGYSIGVNYIFGGTEATSFCTQLEFFKAIPMEASAHNCLFWYGFACVLSGTPVVHPRSRSIRVSISACILM